MVDSTNTVGQVYIYGSKVFLCAADFTHSESLLSFIINSTLNYLRVLWLVPEEAYAVHKMSGYDERSNLAQLRRGEIMEGGRFPIPSSPLCVLKTEL